jgi:hypothetical protein
VTERDLAGPAFYAAGRPGRWRDVRALLHPPYTAWHLSYVVLGAVVAPRVNWTTLAGTLLAFFLAVGVAAHALDELQGRPLATSFPSSTLWVAAAAALAGAIALGVVGLHRVGPGLVVFIVVGTAMVVGYNLELFGGLVHNDLGFALAWGAFPVLTSAYAQTRSVSWPAAVLAGAAALFSLAQRSLSTPVRLLRRTVTKVEGEMTLADDTKLDIERSTILGPPERALHTLSWAISALALALLFARR